MEDNFERVLGDVKKLQEKRHELESKKVELQREKLVCETTVKKVECMIWEQILNTKDEKDRPKFSNDKLRDIEFNRIVEDDYNLFVYDNKNYREWVDAKDSNKKLLDELYLEIMKIDFDIYGRKTWLAYMLKDEKNA